MLCRMCLLDSENTLCIFDETAARLPIASTIAKHFWFQITKDDPVSIMICCFCWLKIENFHEYYQSVEETQRRLTEATEVKVEVVLDVKREPVTEEAEEKVFSTDAKAENSKTSRERPVFVDVASTEADFDNGTASEADDNFNHADDFSTKNETESSDDEPLAKKLIRTRQRRSIRVKNITKNKTSNVPKEIKTENIEKPSELPLRRRGRPRTRNLNDLSEGKRKQVRNIKSEFDEESDVKAKESEYLKMSQKYDEEIAQFMKLRCDLCNIELSTFCEVKRHYREQHNRRGYVSCCSSRKFYKRVFLYEHIQKHKNPDYFKCKYCHKVYCGASVLRAHMQTHDASFEKLYQCDKCPSRFDKLSVLNHHKITHMPKEEPRFSCEICGKLFRTKNTCDTHRKTVHEKIYSKICHICGKVISGKTLFAKHQLVHVDVVDSKAKCQTCGIWLKNEFRLKIHTRKHHTNQTDGQHSCHICGKVSTSRFGLKSHMKYVHDPIRKHICTICDKGFKKPLNLREHMTTHTGSVLYTCPHCPKTFNSNANMHSHRKKVHRQEWEESRRNRGLPVNTVELKVTEI